MIINRVRFSCFQALFCIQKAFIEATVSSLPMIFVGLCSTRKAIDISLADDHFLLPAVDLFNLVLCTFCELANFTDHYFELQDVILGLLVHLMELLDLLFYFFLARECTQLAIDALNVQLTAEI